MTAEGPRKGEPSTKTMRYGLRIQPAPLVRGSSRRIMSLRFRPAHISVINRRACYSVVIGTPVRKFFLSLPTLSIRGERSPSRIHVVALRASLTDCVLHQNCSAHESERKNILAPQQSRGLDTVTPYQFSVVVIAGSHRSNSSQLGLSYSPFRKAVEEAVLDRQTQGWWISAPAARRACTSFFSCFNSFHPWRSSFLIFLFLLSSIEDCFSQQISLASRAVKETRYSLLRAPGALRSS